MIRFVVCCDHPQCTAQGQQATTWVRARYLSKKEGWQQMSTKDYCPEHRLETL